MKERTSVKVGTCFLISVVFEWKAILREIDLLFRLTIFVEQQLVLVSLDPSQ